VDYRALMVAAVVAAGMSAQAGAETVADGNGIAVKESSIATPARGMTMGQVANKFGEPVAKVPGVGQPPISRWEYAGFVVYFERDHVIHTVVAGSPPDASPAASPAGPASSAAAGRDPVTLPG